MVDEAPTAVLSPARRPLTLPFLPLAIASSPASLVRTPLGIAVLAAIAVVIILLVATCVLCVLCACCRPVRRACYGRSVRECCLVRCCWFGCPDYTEDDDRPGGRRGVGVADEDDGTAATTASAASRAPPREALAGVGSPSASSATSAPSQRLRHGHAGTARGPGGGFLAKLLGRARGGAIEHRYEALPTAETLTDDDDETNRPSTNRGSAGDDADQTTPEAREHGERAGPPAPCPPSLPLPSSSAAAHPSATAPPSAAASLSFVASTPAPARLSGSTPLGTVAPTDADLASVAPMTTTLPPALPSPAPPRKFPSLLQTPSAYPATAPASPARGGPQPATPPPAPAQDGPLARTVGVGPQAGDDVAKGTARGGRDAGGADRSEDDML